MNTLSRILSRKNIEIFTLIAEEECSLRDIAEKLKCSPGKVHQAVTLFKNYNLIKVQKKKNKHLLSPNRKNPLSNTIKALLNIHQLLSSHAYKKLQKIGVVGVYGSYARGTDTQQSDVDVLILTTIKELKVREHIRLLETELHKRVNPLIMTKSQLQSLERRDPAFYFRLTLTTIPLHGEIFD